MTNESESLAHDPANVDSQLVSRPQVRPVTLIKVWVCGGIWQVTKDGYFYGHYMADQPAVDAAESAALAIVAGGGTADILWNDGQRRATASNPTTGSDVASNGVTRTMQFRVGSTRVVT
jgi:hypothetical protein